MDTWTPEDIAKLRAAILAVATGTAVLTVKYSGPPAREMTYKQADLGEMQALLARMEAKASGRPSYIRLGTSKGL